MLLAEYAGTDTEFLAWLVKADAHVQILFGGMGILSLPDEDWRKLYDSGMGPEAAAEYLYPDETEEFAGRVLR